MRKNVYQALQERIGRIFNEYDYVYLSFSGGKDSGVLLNACIEHIKHHGGRMGVFHLDYEVQYSLTTEYVDDVLASDRDILDVYRCCVPFKVGSSASMYERFWRPWDPCVRWVREMPEGCLTSKDFDFYTEEIWDYDFQECFAFWLRRRLGVEKVACLVGIRTQESFNRWRSIYRSRPGHSAQWIHSVGEGLDNIYPLYDWHATDIWTANGRFHWRYNKLYDIYYQAGVPLNNQRVASPFITPAISSLHLYRVIEPEMWGKMLGRVNGVNFAGLYGNSTAMGWRAVRLPDGMTWKKYLFFLLETLPEDTRNNYLNKLDVSRKFWREKGGCLTKETIDKLRGLKVPFKLGGNSGYRTAKTPVMMEYLDDINLPEFRELPSYKRMCICILKNDHCCKYMGFSPNKQDRERRQKIIEEYGLDFNG